MFPSHKLPNGIAFQMSVRFFLVEGFLMLNEVLVYHIVVVFLIRDFIKNFNAVPALSIGSCCAISRCSVICWLGGSKFGELLFRVLKVGCGC